MIHIIYINGPSSAGKTTLALALQSSLQELWLHIGIDSIIDMMPARANDWQEDVDRTAQQDIPVGLSISATFDDEGQRIHTVLAGPFMQKLNTTFHEIARAIAQQDHYLIIDDVAKPDEVAAWRAVIDTYGVLYIGLTAPIAVLEARERLRADRSPGLARAQLAILHKNVTYDLFFNTAETTIESMVAQVIHKLYNT